MTNVAGKVTAVTGAGSGIGRALALELAGRGARLALSDVDSDALAETASMLGAQAPAAAVHTHELDVVDRPAFAEWVGHVVGHYGVVHQVYNNAGIAFAQPVRDADWSHYERILGVNLWGVIYGCRLFLPHLIESGDGHVINISSLNGYMAQPELSAYCTSKFAVRGFTESLRAEMAAAQLPVHVTCVHPGGVRTNIAIAGLEHAAAAGRAVTDADRERVRAYTETFLRMDPRQAARTIVDGVQRNRGRVLVGTDARVLDLLVRLLPGRYDRVTLALNRFAGRH